MMIAEVTLALVPVLAIAAALVFLRSAWEGIGAVLLALSALAGLALSLFGSESHANFPSLLLGLQLGLDGVGRVFLFLTALLWLAASIYARGYLKNDPARRRFFFYFALTMAGNLGLTISRDAVGFYLFFALMSFASYGLIAHDRTARARRAGRVYLYLVIASEILIFTALVLIVGDAGNLHLKDVGPEVERSAYRNLLVACIAMGFGIKASLLPLHVWLPLAHPAAPTPASAVLSGAMIKAGLLGWMRFLPVSEVALPTLGSVLIAAGLVAALFAVLVGLGQRDTKTVLAYSSISQMGLMTVALGIGVSLPGAWPGARWALLLYALHHGLAKGALFLAVGIADKRLRFAAGGLIKKIGLVLPALALAGAPWTSGAAAKAVLKAQKDFAPAPWPDFLSPLLSLSALATTLLLAHWLFLVWPRQLSDRPAAPAALWSWLSLVAAVALFSPMARSLGLSVENGHLADLWQAGWPLASGIVLAVALARGRSLPLPLHIPAGDVLSLWTWLAGHARTLMAKGERTLRQGARQLRRLPEAMEKRGDFWLRRLGAAEERLQTWHWVGLGFLLLVLSVFVLGL